jgi:hypothetical protein
MPEFELLQMPPATVLLSIVINPSQTAGVPVMGWRAFTVTTVVASHPAGVV